MKILDTIHLTNNQQIVLALIASNKEKPAKAAQSVSTGTNIVAARNSLMSFGLISYTSSHAILTDKGEKMAVDCGLIDDSGSLTPDGTALLSKLPGQQPAQNQQIPQPIPDQMGAGTTPGMDMGTQPGMESFSILFKTLLTEKLVQRNRRKY